MGFVKHRRVPLITTWVSERFVYSPFHGRPTSPDAFAPTSRVLARGAELAGFNLDEFLKTEGLVWAGSSLMYCLNPQIGRPSDIDLFVTGPNRRAQTQTVCLCAAWFFSNKGAITLSLRPGLIEMSAAEGSVKLQVSDQQKLGASCTDFP